MRGAQRLIDEVRGLTADAREAVGQHPAPQVLSKPAISVAAGILLGNCFAVANEVDAHREHSSRDMLFAMEPDDTLTVADPASSVSVRDSSDALPGSIGRFRLVRLLGEGGMGSVHEAWDNELERRVALKLLRGDSADRARLLDEARAMARVDHDAVITIYDAATIDGRDFIAMELVDGDTLGHWVERARPPWREIVRAFVAAAHGLAAAHDVGLVHRDFKPSNVLRASAGRIAVADFGLARPTGTGSSAIAGTPKYMAPEQWDADDVAPTADQYSLCVALWEALAGEMPPGGADKVRRGLRSILKRGMAEKPGERWPNMRALIAALEGVLAFRRRAAIAGGLLGLACAFAIVVASRGGTAGNSCGDPPISPDAAWSPERAAAVRAVSPRAADLLAGDVASWSDVRTTACEADPRERAPRIACLDVVMQYIDATVEGVLIHPPPENGDGLAETLIEPALCRVTPPPGLKPLLDGERPALLRERLAVDGEPFDHAAAFADSENDAEPCTQLLGAVALYAGLDMLPVDERVRLPRFETLESRAVRCGDEIVVSSMAEVALVTGSAAGIEEGERSAKRLPRVSLRVLIAKTRGEMAQDERRWDESLRQFALVEQLAGRRAPLSYLRGRLGEAQTYLARGAPGDPEKALAIANELRSVRAPRLGTEAVKLLQEARWRTGDIAGADEQFEVLKGPAGGTTTATGRVVDESGAPVAGAEVGSSRTGDAVADGIDFARNRYVTATTDADGRFTLHGLRPYAVIGARKGDRAAVPRTAGIDLRLVLVATGTVSGRLNVPAGAHAGQFDIQVRAPLGASTTWAGLTPVKADGTFTLAGVPRLPMRVLPVTHAVRWTASPPVRLERPERDLILEASPSLLTVIAHSDDSSPPALAMVFAFVGRTQDSMTVMALLEGGVPMTGFATARGAAAVPAAWRERVHPEDLISAIPDHDVLATRVCAAGLTFDAMIVVAIDPTATALLTAACVQVVPGADAVELTLPPVKRLR